MRPDTSVSSTSASLSRTGSLLFLLAILSCSVNAKAMGMAAGPCFNSTQAIIMAQLGGQRDFWICPDTTIDIGLPANPSFTSFVNGDFPLSALSDNVTIQCGENGKSSNHCVLNGGLYQFITTPNNPFVLPNKVTTNNLKVKGITFTGSLPAAAGLFPSSILVGTPGTNMVFEDCVFRDLSLAGAIVKVQRDAFSTETDLPKMSAFVTLKKSKFRNIHYGGTMIQVSNQTLNLKNNKFTDIAIDTSLCNCTDLLLINALNSDMDMTGNTFTNVETKSGIAYAQGNLTHFTYLDNEATGLTILDIDSRPFGDYCEAGLIVDLIINGRFDKCYDLFD